MVKKTLSLLIILIINYLLSSKSIFFFIHFLNVSPFESVPQSGPPNKTFVDPALLTDGLQSHFNSVLRHHRHVRVTVEINTRVTTTWSPDKGRESTRSIHALFIAWQSAT